MADRVQLVVLGGLCVLGTTTVAMVSQLASMAGKLDLHYQRMEHPMQTLKQTVNNAAGDPVEIVTTRNDGESVADFYARHKAVVDYVKEH